MQIDLVLFDAGNTVVFVSHEAIADVVTALGHPVDARVLARVEGFAKRHYEERLQGGLSHEDAWGLYLRTLLEAAGLSPKVTLELIEPLRRTHDVFNLWRRVPRDLVPALDRLRSLGFRLAVVSNSEGKLPELFERVGLGSHFEAVFDSHDEGVSKPDPRLFERALTRLEVAPKRAVYLGDIPGVDIDGAHSAGMKAVLVDPLGFYPSHESSPRVSSVAEFVERFVTGARSSLDF